MYRPIVSLDLASLISHQKENVMFEFESAFINKIISMKTSGSFGKKLNLCLMVPLVTGLNILVPLL
jgi:hypothetical protein